MLVKEEEIKEKVLAEEAEKKNLMIKYRI